MYFEILYKLQDLLKKDEALAKDYFYDVMTNPDTYDNVNQEDIVRLFEEIKFSEENIDFKMSVLSDSSIPNLMRMPTQYEIFMGLIDSRERHELIYSDDYVDLLYRYSEMKGFIDDDYVSKVLENQKFLHPHTLYYVLTSPHIRYVKNELIEKALNQYELYENTMYMEGLTILNNPAFIQNASNRQIESLVNRISLNLPSKESKKFILEVLKNPYIRDKYNKYGKILNFKYLDGLKEAHVFPILAQKGYYKNAINVTDKDAAMDLINYFIERDPMFLEYFDYKVLNDTTMQLDKDLLFGLIKSSYQNKLITLSTSRYSEVFVKCANYLNSRYPNKNVSDLIGVLENRYIPDFVTEEISQADIPMLTHYLLNNTSMHIKTLEEYEYRIMKNLDLGLKAPFIEVPEFKSALCMNRYGFSYEKVCALYRMYGPFVESVDDERLKKEFKEFREIIFGKDKRELFNKYMTNIFSFDKANTYEEDLKRAYTIELSKSILSSDDLVVNDDMYHDGEIVPVVRVTGDFRGLISAVGFVTNLDVINDSYRDSLINDTNHNLHALSTSLYTSDNPSRVTGKFILGYSDFGPDTVQASATVDIYSESDKYKLYSEYKSVYVPPREMGLYTRQDYNELLIERRNRNPNDPNYLANIYPSYVFLDNDNQGEVQRAIKASRDLGIPLVYFDRSECIKKNKQRYVDLRKSYKGETAEEFIELANVIFSMKNSSRSDDFAIFKDLVDKLIANVKDKEDLLVVEEFLLREINKGGSYNYTDIYGCICDLRRSIYTKVDLPILELDKKWGEYINNQIQSMVDIGMLTTLYGGKGIQDAHALANACVYVYNKLNIDSREYSLYEVIKAAIISSACFAQYKYDYRKPTNMDLDVEETDIFHDHRRLIWREFGIYNLDDVMEYKYHLGRKAFSDDNILRKITNISLSLIEGEDVNDMSVKLGVDLYELLGVRDQLISVYNNGVKKVASNKK